MVWLKQACFAILSTFLTCLSTEIYALVPSTTAAMKKPVLTIFYQFNPWQSSIGGIQTFICHFLKFAPPDFEVRLVGTGTPSDHLDVWQQRDYEGTPVHFLPIIALEQDDVRGLIPTTLKYTAALRKRPIKSDFLHFYRIEPTLVTRHWPGEKTFFVQNDIEKQLDRNLSPNAILWQAFPQGYLWLERWLIPQFDILYSCNRNAAQFYERRFPQLASQIHVLKNTVDTQMFYPVAPAQQVALRQSLLDQYALPPETRFLLFAGRLHPQKDPLLLIQSLAALADPTVHLLMAGEGELLVSIKAEIERCQMQSQVTLLGGVSQQRLADLHRMSSCFILTSAYEGLPFAALEALASGTPVVTTAAGETPSVLTPQSGVVCVERTPQAIAQSIQRVLDNPSDFPEIACLEAIQPYTAQTVVAQVYDQMRQSLSPVPG